MSQQGTGAISENDLMRKLVNAKKIMNAVDGGTFTTGNINTSTLLEDPEVLMQNTSPASQRNIKPLVVNEDKIRGSKLPDSIKEAMIKNPIPTMEQISLSDSLDMNFIQGAKKLMEREGLSKSSPQQNTNRSQPTQSQQSYGLSNDDLRSLIKETIKDTLEEIVDKKLNLILTAQQTVSINENLVLKVGDSIFRGKITGVDKSK